MSVAEPEVREAPAPGTGASPKRTNTLLDRLVRPFTENRHTSWRVPLRMARRTAWRERGRASMVVLLIALPVGAVAGASIAASTSGVVNLRAAAVSLGKADAVLEWSGVPAHYISVFGEPAPSSEPIIPGDPHVQGVAGDSPPSSLPAGLLPGVSRTVVRLTGGGTVTYDGRPYRRTTLVEVDLADSLLAGTFDLVSGRLPATSDEVVVSQSYAQRIGLGSRPILTIPGQGTNQPAGVRVVGVVRDTAFRDTTGTVYARPGALHLSVGDSVRHQYWVQTAAAVHWSEVLRLGGLGWRTTSAAVLADPPNGCTDRDQYCDAKGQQPAFGYQSGIDSGGTTVAALATVMALLQVVLLVGPAFAVGLRRRRRDLGLLLVSGARPGQLRRVVLAEGVVLGIVGSLVGVVIGWLAVLGLRGQLERGGSTYWLGLPVVSPLVLVVAAFGLATAVVAAALPARAAARTDAASAVGRGTVHQTTREGTRRVRILGALAVVGGTAVVLAVGVGRAGEDGFRGQTALIALLTGCIAAELGVVTLTPTLIEYVARLASQLPLTPRLALRDAARNRLRSGAAVAAVTAAMAAAVAALLYSTSTAAAADRAYQPSNPIGSVIVKLNGPADAKESDQIRAEVGRAMPLKASWTVPVLQAYLDDSKPGDAVTLVTPVAEQCPAAVLVNQGVTDQARLDAAAQDPRCQRADRDFNPTGFFGLVVGDGNLLAAMTGVDSPEARKALADGGAVVFSKHRIADGKVTLEVDRGTGTKASGQGVVVRTVVAEAAVIEDGFVPSSVFVSPPLATRLGVPATSIGVYGIVAHPVSGAQVDAANAAVSRLTGADSGAAVVVEQGRSRTSSDLLLLALVLTAVVLAAAAAITAGGLALADSRADLATLAAVGGPPRVRRRLAAAQAGVLTLIGCWLGVGAGFLPGWSMVHSTNNGYGPDGPGPMMLVVPWGWIGALTLGLPLVTALVVGLAVRSRITLNRRTD